MSIVGTRPPLISETNLYEPRHKARLAIKPGITGMWQVSGRSDITDFEEVVRLDKEYIENWDIGLDIKILLKLVQGVTIIGLQNLSEVVRFLEGKNVDVNRMSDKMEQEDWEKVVDFADVKGQKELIDAVILAAAGGHNMLMIGEPGCGKTMIAQRIPTILPEMTEEEGK